MTTRIRTTAATLPALAGAAAVALLAGCTAPTNPADDATTAPPSPTPEVTTVDDDAVARFAELEEAADARIGVAAVDLADGEVVEHRADERFAYASTIKVAIAAQVLAETDEAGLDELVRYDRSDLLEHAPITEQHVETGMTVRDLLDASVRYSDNTAANLLIEHVGGIEAFAGWLADAGDTTTIAARVEPDLNEATPGDERDTTTPTASTALLQAVAVDDLLDEEDRAHLVDLLVRNTTGDDLIRSVAPEGWTVGDKTGSAGYGTRNDIAVLWPDDGGEPVVVTVFTTFDDADAASDDALVAAAAEIAFDALLD